MERITIDCTPAQLSTWITHMTALNDATLNSLNALLKPHASIAAGGTGTTRHLFDTDTNR